jgi:hypothetical protein
MRRAKAPDNVSVDEFGCHLWLGRLSVDGYALAPSGHKMQKRQLEERLGHELPPGVFADHLCRRRACINPLHLDPVTQGENEKRKLASYRRTLTRCPLDHKLVDPLRTPEGGLICQVCLDAQG